MTQPLTRIALHGVPRSGTSWIGEILNSSEQVAYRYQPLFSYAHKSFLTENSTATSIDEFFLRLLACRDDFTNQADKRRSGAFPRFAKVNPTHVAYKEVRYAHILPNLLYQAQDVRLCCVIRNPLSTISSWLNAPREFRPDLGWSPLEEWRHAAKKNQGRPEEFHGFEKWKEATGIFLSVKEQYPDRVHLITYSRFLRELETEVQTLFTFCGLAVGEQTRLFLTDSTSRSHDDAYAVFRYQPEDNGWRTKLLPEIRDAIIAEVQGSRLEPFLEL